MIDDQWRERQQQLALRQRRRAEQFRNELAPLRQALFLAEREGRHTAAQGIRNRIVYRERIIARQDEQQ